jgi:hypothetical protein
MMLPPTTFTLKLLTTLDNVEQGPRWSATDASGHQAYTFSRMSRAAIVAFLAPFGTVVRGVAS